MKSIETANYGKADRKIIPLNIRWYQFIVYLYIIKQGNMNIKAQYEAEVKSLKVQIAYCSEALTSNLAEWERKEYELVKAEAEQEVETLTKLIAIC